MKMDPETLHTCRFRVFGGSSNRWGGWCRPLEPEDFAARSWVPQSGWPISAADLEPFYDDAAELLALPAARFDVAAWADVLPPRRVAAGALAVGGLGVLAVQPLVRVLGPALGPGAYAAILLVGASTLVSVTALAMVTPAIFIGFLSGSATGIASTRRMTSGGRVATPD